MNKPLALLALSTLATLVVAACGDNTNVAPTTGSASISPSDFIKSVEDGDFQRVELPWRFQFPADHGPHGSYRTEWWHLTGVLAGDKERPLGVALSLVRIGLVRDPPEHASRWATADIYMGLLSISADDTESLHTYQRVSRDALGLAGARAQPMQVWIENWRLQQAGTGKHSLDLEVHIRAEDDFELELELRAVQPLVDSSDIAARDQDPPAPFVFYIQPRLSAEGTLNINGRREPVSGSISMEHAWGELPLPGGPVARDRFTLYPDDGAALFAIRTHSVASAGDPTSTGLLIDKDGNPHVLSGNDMELEPVTYWSSDRTTGRYPVHWALRIPRRGIEWELHPYSANQEGIAWAPFWAGPVRLQTDAGTPAGRGFLHLNGYTEP